MSALRSRDRLAKRDPGDGTSTRAGRRIISLDVRPGGRVLATWVIISGLFVTLVLWARPWTRPHNSADVLRVGTIEMVDRAGSVRLRIGVGADGTPSVRLYDYAGTRRLELTVRPDGPAVRVFDGQGVERRILEASPALEPSGEDQLTGP